MDQNDPECPIVIYLPLRKNPNYQDGWNPSPKLAGAYTPTPNFAYTKDQVKQLAKLTQFTMREESSKKLILHAIAHKINQKVPGTIPVKK